MALADYYARNALAATQVLAGFDEQKFRNLLESVRIGITLGTDAAERSEGRALLDMQVRLLARLYPSLTIRGDNRSQRMVEGAMDLARRINPSITFSTDPTVEIVIGEASPMAHGCRRIFVGSDGWNAFVGTKGPRTVGGSANPFGPGVAACLSAANLFRLVFQCDQAELDIDSAFSVLEGESRPGADATLTGSFGEIVQVGVGAIGNASAWALARVPMAGIVHLVDHEAVDLGNLQRYVLTERSDEAAVKVDIAVRNFRESTEAKPHVVDFEHFVSSTSYRWSQMILALDSARDRRAAQASLPKWIANAWTQPGDLGVSTHDFLDGACVACLYLADRALENEDVIVADALGVHERALQIRTLLYNGEGVQRELLDAIASARAIPVERLLPFEGRPIRSLYTEGFCGGAVIPMGEAGMPRQEVHVPLAHQSALAGILLAAAAIKQALGRNHAGTKVTRINVMQPLGTYLTQQVAKDSRGICICQDSDYREVYSAKYSAQGIT